MILAHHHIDEVPRVGGKNPVGFVGILKIDDIEIIAQLLAHQRDRVNPITRNVGDIERDQFFDSVWSYQRHMPQDQSAPVMPDEYSAFQLECVEQPDEIRDEFIHAVLIDA